MFLASSTSLSIGIVMIILGLIAGAALFFWTRNVRKAGRKAGLRNETILLIISVGLALTAMLMIIGILTIIIYFRQ